MVEKNYRITTTQKTFETDNVGLDYLKENNNIFYAREKQSDKWQKIIKIEKRTSISEKLNPWGWFLFGILWLGSTFTFPFLASYFFNSKDFSGLLAIFTILWLYWLGPFLIFSIGEKIDKELKKIPSYYKRITTKNIKNIIQSNKWLSTLPSSNPYKNYSSRSYSGGGYSGGGSGGARSGSYSGGSSSGGGGSFGGTSTYVPANDINKALKDFETNGKDVNALVNNVSDEEREKLFSKYFKDEDKGQYANDKFNRDIAWPARKQTLEKILNEAEYEDDETKDNLSEKINNLGEEISNEDFQATAKEIRTFQERKRAKDNHIKYEGRLSNKDIKAIKDVLGYVCMGCGLDPVEEYGEQMKGILEAHHKKPWAEIKENETRTVIPEDFLILCPNCHRIIHRLEHPDDLKKLKEIVGGNRDSYWFD